MLTHDVRRIREKRTTVSRQAPTNAPEIESRPAIENAPPIEAPANATQVKPKIRIAWLAEAIQKANATKEVPTKNRPLTERAYSNVPVHEDLAQRVADWPNRQLEPMESPMDFDAAVIDRFLQHAARFVLRYDKKATQKDVDELMKNPVTFVYGRKENPPSDVELAVRTVQKWQYCQEITTMMENVPGWNTGRNVPNPRNFRVHIAADETRSVESPSGKAKQARFVEGEKASIKEIIGRPKIPSSDPWVLVIRIPVVYTIAIVCSVTGDATAVTEDWFPMTHNVYVRTDSKTLQFKGPPSQHLPLSLAFANQDVRMRLCEDYVIIDENLRFDHNGVSNVLRNDAEMNKEPTYEVMFLDTVFDPLRIRFAGKLAELDCIEGVIMLTEVLRSKPIDA